jgi:bacterioferritin-associated ferredoxin
MAQFGEETGATDGECQVVHIESYLILRSILISCIRVGIGDEMVVCVCNAIKEKDLRAAVQSGAEKPSTVYAQLGRKPKCGQCLAFAESIIKSEVATA